MLIRFFKSNNVSALVFLSLIALVLWVLRFIFPVTFPAQHTMPFYSFLADILVNLPRLSTLLALLLVVSEAFLLNYIINENRILTNQSYLPALFYILFMSNDSSMLMLHPPLCANFFILLAIHQLINSYRKDKAFSEVFDAGFLISIATLFYFPYMFFIPVLGVAFILLRPFIWREWIISFLGLAVPYCFVIVYYFWNDALTYLWHEKIIYHVIPTAHSTSFPKSFYFLIFIGSGIILLAMSKLFGGLTGGSQKSKKSLILLIWFFCLSGLLLFFLPEISFICFSAITIPVSVFCANYFLNIKKEWWAELLLLLLFSSISINLLVFFF